MGEPRRRGDGFRGWPACDVCGGPVTDPTKASLSMDEGAAWRMRGEYDAWDERKKAEKREAAAREGLTGMALTLAAATWGAGELLSAPRTSPDWMWTHDRCTPPTQSYEIGGDRFDTPGKVLDWTFHLAGKGWCDLEAWEKAVGRFWDLPDA